MKDLRVFSTFILAISFLMISVTGYAQSISISKDGTAPDPSAMLDVKSTDKGLLVPRMVASDRLSIPGPATGLIVYQMDGASGFYYNGGTSSSPSWVLLIAGPIKGSDIASGVQTTTNTTLALGNTDNTAAELRLKEPSNAGNNYTAFKAQQQSADITYTLPAVVPSGDNKVLNIQSVDGNNVILDWSTPSTGSTVLNRTDISITSSSTEIDAAGKSFIRITSANGAFNINGISGGVDGQLLIIVNLSNQAMTIVNESASGNPLHRIHTAFDSNMVKIGGETSNYFIYDGGQGRWRLM